jgi:hypothetical protein
VVGTPESVLKDNQRMESLECFTSTFKHEQFSALHVDLNEIEAVQLDISDHVIGTPLLDLDLFNDFACSVIPSLLQPAVSGVAANPLEDMRTLRVAQGAIEEILCRSKS